MGFRDGLQKWGLKFAVATLLAKSILGFG